MVAVLFAVMFAAAPAFVFLFQAFLVVPPLFVLAGILVMVPRALEPAQAPEALTFMAFFAAHLVIFSGFYWGIARGVAALISRIRNTGMRSAALAFALGAAASVPFLPVYGFGVMTKPTWGPLWLVMGTVNESYGRHAVAVVYGAFLLLAAAWALYRRRRG